jgi:hypothetical protein
MPKQRELCLVINSENLWTIKSKIIVRLLLVIVILPGWYL